MLGVSWANIALLLVLPIPLFGSRKALANTENSFCLLLALQFFGLVLGPFSVHFWATFGGPDWVHDRLKRRQDGPKKDIKSLKVPKTTCPKHEILPFGKHTIRVLDAPQTTIGGPGRLPRGT